MVFSFDPPAVRRAFQESADAFVGTLTQVDAAAWDRLALGEWSVRDLAGHASRALSTVETYLAAGPVPVEVAGPVDYYAVLASAHAGPDAIALRAREAGVALGEDPASSVAALRTRVAALVAATPDDAPVATPVGGMRLIDYLPSRVMELTVHRMDLETALSLPAAREPHGLAVSLALAALLATSSPHAARLLCALTGRGPLDGFSVL